MVGRGKVAARPGHTNPDWRRHDGEGVMVVKEIKGKVLAQLQTKRSLTTKIRISDAVDSGWVWHALLYRSRYR